MQMKRRLEIVYSESIESALSGAVSSIEIGPRKRKMDHPIHRIRVGTMIFFLKTLFTNFRADYATLRVISGRGDAIKTGSV